MKGNARNFTRATTNAYQKLTKLTCTAWRRKKSHLAFPIPKISRRNLQPTILHLLDHKHQNLRRMTRNLFHKMPESSSKVTIKVLLSTLMMNIPSSSKLITMAAKRSITSQITSLIHRKVPDLTIPTSVT